MDLRNKENLVKMGNSDESTRDANYNRADEVKAFDDTRTGVKGLVDSGISKVPTIFIAPSNEVNSKSNYGTSGFQIPVIDLQTDHQVVVDGIKYASEKCGFFQVVNHGVPLTVLDEIIKGVTRFNEQDDEVKKQYYSRDPKRRVKFNSNFDLYQSKAANWRDTLIIDVLGSAPLDPHQLPAACRDATIDYTKHISILGDRLFELLSQALWLKADHLKQMKCDGALTFAGHYYPACPEPELTLGTTSHTDASFITVVLQDDIGGLQVLQEDNWLDVHPTPGALVINMGDFLQMISNDKFKSVEHRVVAKHVGPRISVACFLSPDNADTARLYGPIKEMVAEGGRPLYREFTIKEYYHHFYTQGLDGQSGLDSFKL